MKRILALFLIAILLTTGCRQTKDICQQVMIGETFCLSGTSGKYFYQLPSEITEVYGYDSNGRKVIYNESDYVVDYDIGTIRRTEQSHIPDYQNHKVTRNNDGKFDFASEPRNPELNVLYQIHVSYTYEFKEKIIENKSIFLSDKTITKLDKNKTIKIAILGDSISSGAQTTSQYFRNDQVTDTFAGLIKQSLENTYGCKVDLSLVAQGGTDRYFAIQNLESIIEKAPDVVIVEFGMNDHAGENPMNSEIIDSFENDMNGIVCRLKNEGIDVVIVGFFQQNMDWSMENINATEKYNSILEKVAENNNVYFADVKSLFNKVCTRKNLEEDVTVDYMHHPSDWGHMLYYSTIVPVFNVNNCIKANGYYIN